MTKYKGPFKIVNQKDHVFIFFAGNLIYKSYKSGLPSKIFGGGLQPKVIQLPQSKKS